ncbi:MAG: 2-dehydropantoate 2-reductase [Desulfobacteraceae bacterium]|jgi:2-dehydropantoate 2-reductase
MKTVVLGAGAMGCLFGGGLKTAGNDVLLVDVWKDHVERINSHGLAIDREGERQTVQVPACLPEEVGETPDLVLVFTKSFHTEAALTSIAGALAGHTHVMTLQNGVGHVEVIQKFVDPARIIHGVTTYPCDILGPGHIRTQGEGQTKIMTVHKQHSEVLAAVKEMFSSAGFNCSLDPDVDAAIWEKLAFNSAMNALTAVLRQPVGAIGDAEEGRALAFQIVDEVVAVARKQKIAVDRKRIGATVEMALAQHRDHKPSMLQDILKGRKTEIDFINGAAIHAARSFGLTLPVNETVYRLVKTLEKAVIGDQ